MPPVRGHACRGRGRNTKSKCGSHCSSVKAEEKTASSTAQTNKPLASAECWRVTDGSSPPFVWSCQFPAALFSTFSGSARASTLPALNVARKLPLLSALPAVCTFARDQHLNRQEVPSSVPLTRKWRCGASMETHCSLLICRCGSGWFVHAMQPVLTSPSICTVHTTCMRSSVLYSALLSWMPDPHPCDSLQERFRAPREHALRERGNGSDPFRGPRR